jgi:hypothetical protein
MIQPRHRPIVYGLAALILVWLLAWGGYHFTQSARMTAEKVQAYLRSVDLAQLHGAARARALEELAAKLNALSMEERRKARVNRLWDRWFREMSDDEKASFLAATMPSGISQILTAFEKLPQDQRKKTIEDALKQLQEARQQSAEEGSSGPNAPPVLSAEVRQKVVSVGLNAYYSQSSAQTKAELAPLLEEIQRSMETGRAFRRATAPHD